MAIAALALGAFATLLGGCTGTPFWRNMTSIEAAPRVFHTGWTHGKRGAGGGRY